MVDMLLTELPSIMLLLTVIILFITVISDSFELYILYNFMVRVLLRFLYIELVCIIVLINALLIQDFIESRIKTVRLNTFEITSSVINSN